MKFGKNVSQHWSLFPVSSPLTALVRSRAPRRRQFPVAPAMVRRLHGLFALNERVALLGTWRGGFFSITPGTPPSASASLRHTANYFPCHFHHSN